MFQRRMSRYLVYVSLAISTAAGCDSAQVSDLVDKAKQTASEATDKVRDTVSEHVADAAGEVQEQLQMAGSIDLQIDQPLAAQACYVHFLQQGSGRSNVLQLRSYLSVDQESFPSVLLHAQVSAASAQELVGQVVSARLFVQREQNGPIWYSVDGSPVEVKIASIAEQMLTAELVAGTLHNTTSGQTGVTGTFQGVMP